jgi:peptidoglycan/LPS O-acetylase OafA/YrhL
MGQLNLVAGHFRDEIAGLRALAVIGVVLFHLKVAGVGGGFVGVDVFFVISGYLITRNILRDIETDRFTFGGFYVRRARRIMPALIFTVVLTYLIGALWCSPLMFLDLAKECTHALLSIANIQYWRESHQYFAPNSDELALLHCWSLSAEEQFYLVWPLFIVLAKKTERPYLAIAIAALLSLLGAMAVSMTDPLAAFFLMPFRIFEFAVGALVLPLEARFRPAKAVAGAMSAGGILCVAASMVLFSSDMPHLEVAVLVPCLGAAVTIWAGDQSLVSRLLTNRIMMALGAISYSLYLCHWPIIFFARFIFGAVANTPPGMVAATALMLVVAALMYAFVERRFIRPSPPAKAGDVGTGDVRTDNVRYVTGLTAVILGLAAITHLTFVSRGFAWRLPAAQSEETRLQGFPEGADISRPSARVGVQFIGDSLTLEYEYGLRSILQDLQISFRSSSGSGCPLLYHTVPLRSGWRDVCVTARDRALQQIATTNTPIIYAQLWRLYDDASIDYEDDPSIPPVKGAFKKLQLALEATIEKAVARGHRVLLLGEQIDPGCFINLPRLEQGPLPHASQPPCPVTTRDAAERIVAPIDRVLDGVRARWPDRVSVLHPVDYFCDSECPVVMNGLWLHNSRIHLSLAGADYMIRRSEDVFRGFLAHGEESQ